MRESHSLNFTDSQGNVKNTYKDYHLIAKGKPSINPPEVQTEYVEILGRNGLLDMTGGVDGKVYFKNMEAEWSFIVDPRFDYYNVFHQLMDDLHGKKFGIVLNEDDPNTTYTGRLAVSSPLLGEHFNEITIAANIDPNYTRTPPKIAVNSSALYYDETYSRNWTFGSRKTDRYVSYVGKVQIVDTWNYVTYVPTTVDSIPIPDTNREWRLYVSYKSGGSSYTENATITDFLTNSDSIFENHNTIVSMLRAGSSDPITLFGDRWGVGAPVYIEHVTTL